jgi:hypothetical protein
VTCRPVEHGDAATWTQLRQALWSDAAPGEHAEAIERYFAGTLREPTMVLLAEDFRKRARPWIRGVVAPGICGRVPQRQSRACRGLVRGARGARPRRRKGAYQSG